MFNEGELKDTFPRPLQIVEAHTHYAMNDHANRILIDRPFAMYMFDVQSAL